MLVLLVMMSLGGDAVIISEHESVEECNTNMLALAETIKSEHEEGWKFPRGFDLLCIQVEKPEKPERPGKDA